MSCTCMLAACAAAATPPLPAATCLTHQLLPTRWPRAWLHALCASHAAVHFAADPSHHASQSGPAHVAALPYLGPLRTAAAQHWQHELQMHAGSLHRCGHATTASAPSVQPLGAADSMAARRAACAWASHAVVLPTGPRLQASHCGVTRCAGSGNGGRATAARSASQSA